MNDFGTIRLDVTIPSTKLTGCAMLLVEEYKPLVEQALIEAREELMTDENFKEAIKREIKQKLSDRIKAAITDQAAYIADKAIRDVDMFGASKKILKDFFKEENK